ncbi:MAG: sigma-54 dependent transcriptional regulator [Calditerrivibrio sp.]|nr:sigma-54 dependent transcriptional regulator [Calditerrivibrio sp.]
MKNLLIVDDEQNHRLMLRLHLKDHGFVIHEADNGFEALTIIENNKIDIILLDIKMDIMDGLTFLHKIRSEGIDIPVIMISAFDNAKYAVESLKLGAADYITKPVDIDQLIKIIKKLIQTNPTVEQTTFLSDYVFDGIYSERGLGKVISLLKMVAPTDATVLITGESGTGKELIAKSIHKNSPRSKGPFIAVNCAALNENIIESELFGHEKGAFTGAISQKRGKFELADKGTIFLDEIGEIPQHIQVKLLRVLQEKVIERVGSEKSIKVDVRIVAATNRDLKKLVEKGDFREDLYFRLNVFPIHLPPLRERYEEIPLLIDFFIKKYSTNFGKNIKGYTETFCNKLKNYHFPGNIRELENIIERAIILSKNDILDESLLPDLDLRNNSDLLIKNNEKQLILKALVDAKYNKTKAAEILGISRRTLHNKIKEYKLEV